MATDPVELASAVKEYQGRLAKEATDTPPGPDQSGGLVAGLIKQFGLGGDPRLRRALYERLARLEAQYGQKAEILIAEARSLAAAPTVRRPGNYFAHAICLKLREAGIV